MPVATIPGRVGRSSTIEVFEPAQTQDDAEVFIERFELGPNEVREGYVTPSPYTSFRYRDEGLEELASADEARGAAPQPPKLLPHMQAEGEAGQARSEQLRPALEAIDEYQREQGIELPAERAARWQEDVESLKGGEHSTEESSRKVLEGRVNRTQQDMVSLGEDDYESSGSGSGGARTKQAGSAGKAKPGRPAGSTNQNAVRSRAKAKEAREEGLRSVADTNKAPQVA